MDSKPVSVGGEIEAWCTSCRLMKWHVVVAMVGGEPAKVECHGCGKQHGYRTHEPGAPRPRAPARPRAASPARELARRTSEELAARLLAGERDARGYSPRERYAVDELVRHPSFGCGVVTALLGAQKMEVAFRDGRRLLVHDRG
jgi:hypothetical protein